MRWRRFVVIAVALSLFVPTFVAGAQGNQTEEEEPTEETEDDEAGEGETTNETDDEGATNETEEDPGWEEGDDEYQDETGWEEGDDDYQDDVSGVECWEDHEGPVCDATGTTREDAYALLEQAEADGELPFSLDDAYVECHTEDWGDEVRVICSQTDRLVECWEDREGWMCEAEGDTEREAYAKFDREEDTLPFRLDSPYVDCMTDDWGDMVVVHCSQMDQLVECWEDRDGPSCDAFAPTREDARALFEQAQADGDLPFRLDDTYVECQTDAWEDEVQMTCWKVDQLVECWEDRHGWFCEAQAGTADDAYAKFDQEADQLPFRLDDPNVRCDEERWDDRVAAFCFQTPEQDEHEAHQPGAPGEIPPNCEPSSSNPDALVCTPPPECQDRMGQTPECTPPPECSPNGDGTFTCTPPDQAGAEAAPPDCRQDASNPDALVCTPPPECQDRMGQTPECTPPPECSPNGDGTFTCTFPEHGPGGHDGEDERTRTSTDATQDEGLALDARSDLKDAVREALGGFRGELDGLRTAYEEGKSDLEDRYEEKKDELRDVYRACLNELGEDADRVKALEHELACKQQANDDLQTERLVLLAERDLLREDLLAQAETLQFHTCSSLQETLHGILMDEGVFDTNLGTFLGPEDLGLCAGVLINTEQPDIGDEDGFFAGGDR